MENQNTQNLIEKIALFLQENEKRSDDFLHSSFEKINRRLDKIESQIIVDNSQTPVLKRRLSHSSQEKFTNLEELADEIINGLKDEKACPFEPAGKPCDHCAMCSSRGF